MINGLFTALTSSLSGPFSGLWCKTHQEALGHPYLLRGEKSEMKNGGLRLWMLGFRSLNGENRQGPGMGVGGTQQGALVSVSGRLVFLFFLLSSFSLGTSMSTWVPKVIQDNDFTSYAWMFLGVMSRLFVFLREGEWAMITPQYWIIDNNLRPSGFWWRSHVSLREQKNTKWFPIAWDRGQSL